MKNPIKKVILALCIVVAMQVADYFITNLTYPLLDSVDAIMVYDYLTKKGEGPDEDVLFVNVGYDKTLVPVLDEFGDTIGNTPITDRRMLANFLDAIKDSGYKYIFLDIRFEEGTRSEDDSLLFSVMKNLHRFSYSTHRKEIDLVPDDVKNKGGYSDYRGNFRDGFVRYELLQDGKESSAVKMYDAISGAKFRKEGILFFEDDHLAYNMVFTPFYLNDVSSYGEMGRVKYHNLGYELLKNNDSERLSSLTKDKIIVIGDFENDKHQTYIGEVPGPLLTLRTYQLLHRKGARLSWLCFWITSGVYFLILWSLMGKYDIADRICALLKIKSRGMAFILTFIGWGFILSVVKLVLYAIFEIAFVAWLPALVFSLVSTFNDYKRTGIPSAGKVTP